MSNNPLLFISSKGRKLRQSDLEHSLEKVGVKRGDIILIHSDLGVFGKFNPQEIPGREGFFNAITETLKKTVGPEGTILMPTYTYSFLKGEKYDMQKSFSQVGALTEYFRKLHGVARTPNPNLSFAIWGRDKKYFLRRLSRDSYGTDSVFGKLRKKNGKILFLGASFQTATFIHYIEARHGVAYRTPKLFRGKIKNNGKIYEAVYEHPVRIQDRYVIFDGRKLKRELEKRRLFKKSRFGNGEISVITCHDFFKAGMSLLRKDPYFFLHKDFYFKKNDWGTLERSTGKLVKFCRHFKDRKKSLPPNFIKGLDASEVVIIAEKCVLSFLAREFRRFPVQLKYSYRFLDAKDKSGLGGQLQGKRVRRIMRAPSLYIDLIREVNIVEHDL